MQPVLPSPKVAEDIARVVRTRIHLGELGPGDQLPPERDLAVELDVARVSLREALGILRAEGYIASKRGSSGGTFVTELELPYQAWLTHMRANLADFDDLQDYRIAVECRTTVLAAQRATPSELRALEESIGAIAGCADVASFRRADTHFHLGIAEASRSDRLLAATKAVRAELFAPADRYGFTPQAETSAYWHRQIHTALLAGDADAAATAMQHHIERSRREMRELLGMED